MHGYGRMPALKSHAPRTAQERVHYLALEFYLVTEQKTCAFMEFKKTVTKEEQREVVEKLRENFKVVEKLRENFKSAEGARAPREHTVPDKFVVRTFPTWALTLYTLQETA